MGQSGGEREWWTFDVMKAPEGRQEIWREGVERVQTTATPANNHEGLAPCYWTHRSVQRQRQP